MEARIIVTPHAKQRAQERGGDLKLIVSRAKEESLRIVSVSLRMRSPRVAMKISTAPVIPILEVSHRKCGTRILVITVLTEPARIFHPIVSA